MRLPSAAPSVPAGAFAEMSYLTDMKTRAYGAAAQAREAAVAAKDVASFRIATAAESVAEYSPNYGAPLVDSASRGARVAGNAASSAASSAKSAANKASECVPEYDKLAAWIPDDVSVATGRGWWRGQTSDEEQQEDLDAYRVYVCGCIPVAQTRGEVVSTYIAPLLAVFNLGVILYLFQYIWLRRFD